MLDEFNSLHAGFGHHGSACLKVQGPQLYTIPSHNKDWFYMDQSWDFCSRCSVVEGSNQFYYPILIKLLIMAKPQIRQY